MKRLGRWSTGFLGVVITALCLLDGGPVRAGAATVVAPAGGRSGGVTVVVLHDWGLRQALGISVLILLALTYQHLRTRPEPEPRELVDCSGLEDDGEEAE